MQKETIFTKEERETMEWLALVGSLKVDELVNNPNTDKPTLYKHKENITNILVKVLNN